MIEVLVKVSLRNQERNYHKMEVARLQAVHSSKMASLGQMASGVAHEINNPLSIIVGRLSQLKREVQKETQDPAKINDIIQGIERIAFRIAKIIRSLRSFSREASGDPFEEVLVSDIIHETLDLCEQRMTHSNIEIRVKIYPPNMMVECQSVPISQVLINILNNAFDAISELPNRWIELEARLIAETTVQFKIKDSGTGITDEVAQHIMEPFYTTKQVGDGVGLGLSISKGIIESHHGKIYLDRTERNTTFVVEIPQYREFH
jgi:C4-dicarboxylate-specific signal transduction histidine kinase